MEIYLFGSRTDPNVKGGDIDLLVLVPKNWNSQERFNLKIKLLKEIYKRLGERRIDLLIFPKGSKEAEKFLRGAVKLWNT
ncbi:MAG: nucleotidyltransferase domain-containing protein [Gammaproteobacteria bacterium]|nr:MAG: nucleotidyltransferase domain-containing protein [Gammaproteobacteria bacterium]